MNGDLQKARGLFNQPRAVDLLTGAASISIKDGGPLAWSFESPVHMVSLTVVAPPVLRFRNGDGKLRAAQLREGDLFLWPYQGAMEGEFESGRLRCVQVAFADDVGLDLVGPVNARRDADAEWLLRRLGRELQEDLPGGLMFAEGLTLALSARVRGWSGHRPIQGTHFLSQSELHKALDLIEAEMAHNLSLARLAGEAGYSPSHFARLFRAATGEPPHRYVMRRRTERAREMIAGGVGVVRAAHACGFADHSHLLRRLRADR